MILGHTTDLLSMKQCLADAFFNSAIHAIHFGLENMLIGCCFPTPILLNNSTIIILLKFPTLQAIYSPILGKHKKSPGNFSYLSSLLMPSWSVTSCYCTGHQKGNFSIP